MCAHTHAYMHACVSLLSDVPMFFHNVITKLTFLHWIMLRVKTSLVESSPSSFHKHGPTSCVPQHVRLTWHTPLRRRKHICEDDT